jgi:hypothetical protein
VLQAADVSLSAGTGQHCCIDIRSRLPSPVDRRGLSFSAGDVPSVLCSESKQSKAMFSSKDGEKRALFRTNKVRPTEQRV